MAEPDNIMLAPLRGLREETAKLARDHEVPAKRFDAIRQAVNGESFMGRVVAADIEQQIVAMSERLDALEAKRGPRK